MLLWAKKRVNAGKFDYEVNRIIEIEDNEEEKGSSYL